MALDLDDTIVALASAPGPAARAIVRVSGPAAVECIARLFRATEGMPLAAVRSARAIDGEILLGDPPRGLPCRLYLWPSIRSYTREPTAELHLPGSPPLAERVIRDLCAAGARLARPGEFTLRACLAGRLDLTQAEAVLGVIDAEDDRQLHVALAQLAGGLARPLAALRENLLDLLAELEAGLDFAEEDLSFVSRAELTRRIEAAAEATERLLGQVGERAAGGEPFRIVLVGRPNAGKSSLFNALLDESAAVVADVAGTTRDYIARPLNLGGLAAQLIDTAGLDPLAASEALGAAAQQATLGQKAAAGLLVVCLDPFDAASSLAVCEALPEGTQRLLVWTKADLAKPPRDGAETTLSVSSVTGVGLGELRQRLGDAARAAQRGESVVGTALRSAESLRQAAGALARARSLTAAEGGEEFLAAELRLALEHLGVVAGVVYTDDLLGRIFSRFCIGK